MVKGVLGCDLITVIFVGFGIGEMEVFIVADESTHGGRRERKDFKGVRVRIHDCTGVVLKGGSGVMAGG